MSLSLFDLDRTLIDGYAYARLMRELWSEGLRRPGLVKLVLRLLVARATSKRPLSIWWPQAFASYLAGLAPEDVAAACLVAAKRVRRELRPEIQRELLERRAAGDELWLVTATVHPLAEAVSAALDFEECLATRIALEDGRYTRALDGGICRGEEKLRRVRARLAERGLPADLGDAGYYADGKEDLPLLMTVGRPVAVCPDPDLMRMALVRNFRVIGAPRVR